MAGLAALDQDSQAGDIVSHDVVAEAMSNAQIERLRGALARRRTYGNPDLQLRDVNSVAKS